MTDAIFCPNFSIGFNKHLTNIQTYYPLINLTISISAFELELIDDVVKVVSYSINYVVVYGRLLIHEST